MVLIYDGIHYDALFSVGPGGSEVSVHPTTDLSVLDKAKATAKEAKEAHNYTDTAGFTLRMTSGRLQDDFRTTSGRLQDDFRTTSGRLQDNFRTTSGRLQEHFRKTSGRLQDDFRTTSGRL